MGVMGVVGVMGGLGVVGSSLLFVKKNLKGWWLGQNFFVTLQADYIQVRPSLAT